MQRAIKTCKHNIIVTDAPSIRLTFQCTCWWIIVCSNWQH